MNKLPFDVAKALAGEKLVTRDGRDVSQFWQAKPGDKYIRPYRALLVGDKKPMGFFADGRLAIQESDYDLFLIDESDQPAPEVTPAPQMPMVFPPWLTERKFYAAMALQGLLANPNVVIRMDAHDGETDWAVVGGFDGLAEWAVVAAENLSHKENKEPNK